MSDKYSCPKFKFMKKLLILSLISISFISCSSDDDGFTETSIYGTWKAIEYRIGDDVIGSPTPEWEILENNHEITFNENMTYFYENYNIPSCCTASNMCIFEIEDRENSNLNRLGKDYDCTGTIEPVEYFDLFYFSGKYLIISSTYYDIGGREYKYVRVQKDDNSSL